MAGTKNGAVNRAEALHESMLPKALPDNASKNKLDESFLDTLMRCQVGVFIVDVSSCLVC